jgi:K+-transporting ATPase ATPase C chain
MKRQEQSTHSNQSAVIGLVRPVLVSAVFFMIVGGLVYPLVTTGVANILFPRQAQGSVIAVNGQEVGSEVIGQWFTKPAYFHSRPSATTGSDPNDPSKSIAEPYNAGNSGASNLGPTSKKLIDSVTERVGEYRKENQLTASDQVPVDAVTASASGLDPDISVANAQLQAKRVAMERGLTVKQVLALVDTYTRGPQFGLLGYPRVNVLDLNIALDKLAAPVSK